MSLVTCEAVEFVMSNCLQTRWGSDLLSGLHTVAVDPKLAFPGSVRLPNLLKNSALTF